MNNRFSKDLATIQILTLKNIMLEKIIENTDNTIMKSKLKMIYIRNSYIISRTESELDKK